MNNYLKIHFWEYQFLDYSLALIGIEFLNFTLYGEVWMENNGFKRRE